MIEILSRLENIEFHIKKLKGDNKSLAIENETLKRQNAELKKAMLAFLGEKPPVATVVIAWASES